MQLLLFLVGAWSALNVANAFAPRRGRLSRWPSAYGAWVTSEVLPVQAIIGLVLLGVLGAAGGGLPGPLGIVGLVLMAVAVAGNAVLVQEARKTDGTMRGVVPEPGRAPETASPIPAAEGGTVPSPAAPATKTPPGPKTPRFARSAIVMPLLMGRRRGTQKVRNVPYAKVDGRTLRLDLTVPARTRPGDLRPVLLHLHGGGWTIGDKRGQGQPLLYHMAAAGWVCVNANYRRSPAATFPDHLVDCKRALAWIRSRVADYGGDPETICIAGGSAGAHLATLTALTANRKEYQPGFEDIDTEVKAAVSLYGVYDLTNRLGTWPAEAFRWLIEPWVVKGFLAEQPELFTAASPMDQVNGSAPPMLVVHGTRDTVTPVEDARLFVQKLRAESHHPVLYAELAGAQHAFDVFPSLRTAPVVESIERFLSGQSRG